MKEVTQTSTEDDKPKGTIPTTAFEKVAKLSKRIRAVRGGQSAGKTYAILEYLIWFAEKRKININIVGKDIPALKNTAMKDFFDILDLLGLYDPEKHNKTDRTYRLNKSKFKFLGCDEPAKLKGVRADITYFCEANNSPHQAWHELHSRTKLFSLLCWNPDAPFWFDERLLGRDDCDFITLTFQDNEALSDDIKSDMWEWKRLAELGDPYYENLWQTRGLGQLGSLTGAILTNYETIDEIPPHAKYVGGGMDFGFSNDPTTFTAIWEADGTLIWDEVIYEKGLFNPDIFARLKSTNYRTQIIYADQSGAQAIAELRKFGLPILGAKKYENSIIHGLSLMQREPFKVTVSSKNLIKELHNYKWLQDNDGNSLNVPIDKYNHSIDGIRYWYMMTRGKGQKKFGFKWR
ncbi:MAG: hypothetical protein EOO50_05250 [Flavobacterium sp.]|uniref:PBSX family phage terminase large subunit n=1 Tax=Flavobacterium sp. TaxID=239 RepID=UPI00122237BA|nr:terminase large subunit [Flavobacterium sp.]RZJ67690.1 MAG: hypothetical protein EOO50_05250 [Flavobacterium sp.]